MKATTSPDRCNARVQRLARVRFVALPLEHTPPPDTARGWTGRALAALRDYLIRVIGCLEAARP